MGRAAAQRSIFAFVTVVCLSGCLSVSAVQRLTSLGISIWVLASEPADQMSRV
jgi:hypothetical protein